MSPPDTAIEEFRRTVGPANVLVAGDDLDRYAEDGRGALGLPALVVRPGTAEEVAAVLQTAFAHGLAVVPQGARTGLVAAGIADGGEAQVLLSLERVKGETRIDPANRSLTTGAGALLSDVNALAMEHGLFFPIDLGADPSIGGMIAANTGGARFLRYGDVRRNVMALEIVTAEARPRILSLGSELWKDNSALAIEQLIIGSSGALGVVTGATLALSPLPANQVSAMLALPNPEAALDLLTRLEDGFGTLLTAFEGISRNAFQAAVTHVPNLRNPFPGEEPAYSVLVELSGGRAVPAEWLEEQLGEVLTPLFEDGSVADAMIDRGDGLWAVRHAVPEGLRASGKVVACDISLRRGDVMRFRSLMIERLAQLAPQLILHDFGHIGDGGMHFNCVWPHSAGPFEQELGDAAREAIFAACVEEFGGSFSAEHGIGPVNEAWYARFKSEELRRLSGEIQDLIAPMPLGRVDFGTTGTRNPK